MTIAASKVRLGTNSPDGCDAPGLHRAVIAGSASRALLPSESNALIMFDTASGQTFTLPALSTIRIGAQYHFGVSVTGTGTYKVNTSVSTEYLIGGVNIGSLTLLEATDTFIANGSSHAALTMSADTKGRLGGGRVSFTAISATVWFVEGYLIGAGTVIDPFV